MPGFRYPNLITFLVFFSILGEYMFCFGNEFSSFAHKTVYLDFQAGEEAPLVASMGKRHTALTQLETSASNIHEALKVISFKIFFHVVFIEIENRKMTYFRTL